MKELTVVDDPGPTLQSGTHPVVAPDIAAIGYIPLCSNPPQQYVGTPGIGHVFGSGNYDPPPDLRSVDDFVRYLASRREYRGALLISDLLVQFDSRGRAGRVSFKVLTDFFGCGYTPAQKLGFRPSTLAAPDPGSHQWNKRKLAHLKGNTKGGQRLVIQRKNGFVQLVHWQTFRLSGLLALSAQITTGAPVSYAWIQVNYTVHASGAHEAYLTGSSIPTIQTFSSWTPKAKRCMTTNTPSQIAHFLAGQATAPHFGWRERIV